MYTLPVQLADPVRYSLIMAQIWQMKDIQSLLTSAASETTPTGATAGWC